MSKLMPADALTRQLSWEDFPERDLDPPEPGQSVQAAFTEVGYHQSGNYVDWIKDSQPHKYKLTQRPTITMTFTNGSWVADFVFDWPQSEQDELLDHEQVHYMIGVLGGRDCDDAFGVIKGKEYDSAKAGQDECEAAVKLMDVQSIQKKYDADTKGQPTKFPVKQKAWTDAVSLAHTSKKPLRETLKTAGLIS